MRLNAALNTTGLGGQLFFNGTTSTILQVSVDSLSPAGQAIPWGDTLADWHDYQDIAVDKVGATFLAAWSEDARLVNPTANGPSGMYTSRITP